MNGCRGRCPAGSGRLTAAAPMKAGEAGLACAGCRVATSAPAAAIRRSVRIVQGSTYDDLVLPEEARENLPLRTRPKLEEHVDLTKPMWDERFDYRVDILPRRNRVVARQNGVLLGETTRPLLVDEQDHGLVFYFPREDVRVEALRPTESVTYCPFKGRASHWSPAAGGDDVAWTYEQPYPEVSRLAGYVAFYQDRVDLTVGIATPAVSG